MIHKSDATFCNSQQSWCWICFCGPERTRARGLWTELTSPDLKRLDRREASFSFELPQLDAGGLHTMEST